MRRPKLKSESVRAGRIGLIADSHSRNRDGSDLPQAVLNALKDVDLILHLGDMGQVASLDRLAAIAPVLATRGQHAVGRDLRIFAGVRVLETGLHDVGALFDLAGAVPGIGADPEIHISGQSTLEELDTLFGRRVRVVAYAMTHLPYVGEHADILFVNPGSPTLPAEGPGTVAVLDLREEAPRAEIRPL